MPRIYTNTAKRKRSVGFAKTPLQPPPPTTPPPPPSGNYLVPAKGLCESLREMHVSATSCPPNAFSLVEKIEERAGIFSSLRAECSTCGYSSYLDDVKRTSTSFREGTTLNDALCLASNIVGLDYNELHRFCHVMGLDGPPDSWDSLYQKKIWKALHQMTEEQLKKNRQESHLFRGSNGAEPVQISIKSDGTYQKRGTYILSFNTFSVC